MTSRTEQYSPLFVSPETTGSEVIVHSRSRQPVQRPSSVYGSAHEGSLQSRRSKTGELGENIKLSALPRALLRSGDHARGLDGSKMSTRPEVNNSKAKFDA